MHPGDTLVGFPVTSLSYLMYLIYHLQVVTGTLKNHFREELDMSSTAPELHANDGAVLIGLDSLALLWPHMFLNPSRP